MTHLHVCSAHPPTPALIPSPTRASAAAAARRSVAAAPAVPTAAAGTLQLVHASHTLWLPYCFVCCFCCFVCVLARCCRSCCTASVRVASCANQADVQGVQEAISQAQQVSSSNVAVGVLREMLQLQAQQRVWWRPSDCRCRSPGRHAGVPPRACATPRRKAEDAARHSRTNDTE